MDMHSVLFISLWVFLTCTCTCTCTPHFTCGLRGANYTRTSTRRKTLKQGAISYFIVDYFEFV